MYTKQKDKMKTDYDNARSFELALRIINNKNSIRIIEVFRNNGNTPTCVKDIQHQVRLIQTRTSQHLAQLKRIGIVFGEKEGKEVYYMLNTKELDRIFSIANQYSQ